MKVDIIDRELDTLKLAINSQREKGDYIASRNIHERLTDLKENRKKAVRDILN